MRRRLGWLVLVALLCQGCSLSDGSHVTIEGALTETLAGFSSRRALTEPQVLITRQMPSATLALYTFESDQGPNTERSRAVGVMAMQRSRLGWSTTGEGSLTAAPVAQPQQPVQFVTGTVKDEYSFAYGLVSDPAVREVLVTFADGSNETVAVEAGAYLAIKVPAVEVARIEARDAAGQVLYQRDEQEM